MANLFTNIAERVRDFLIEPILDSLYGGGFVARGKEIYNRRLYVRGTQKQALKTAMDNITVNFTGLVASRAVSWMFGRPFTVDFPEPELEPAEGETVGTVPVENKNPALTYIEQVMKANGEMRLFKRVARYGVEAGTCYVKILPGRIPSDDGETLLPRLVAIDPIYVEIETSPDDIDEVLAYELKYMIKKDGKEIHYRERIQRITTNEKDDNGAIVSTTTTWENIIYYANSRGGWEEQSRVAWEYPFPNLLHWQNLTRNGSPYGEPDITDDLIVLQDKFNFLVSNVSKIIRLHAHPKTWGRLFGNMQSQTWGAEDMILSDNPEAHIENLEMSSDLMSSLNFIQFIRQGFFDIARTVDIDSLADKLGSLTNFALRILYQDALDKLEDRRSNYGAALVELFHRLLTLAEFDETDGGVIVWQDVLPVDAKGQIDSLKGDTELGLVSKQTASKVRGYDYANEKKRLEMEQTDNEDNLGAFIIKNFNKGTGSTAPGTTPGTAPGTVPASSEFIRGI